MSASFRSLYLHTFFGSFMPIYALFTLLIVDRGMTPGQVSILLAAWSVTGFLLEVPSGALADRASRKWVLAAGQTLCTAAFALWAIHPSFAGFFAGFVLWGAKAAFVSGTYEAYLYDELAAQGRVNDYVAVYGRLMACRSIAALLAAVSAAPLSTIGYPAVIWISVGASTISTLTAASLPEAPRAKQTGGGAYVRILREGLKTAVGERRMLAISLGLAAAGAFIGMTGDYGPIMGRLSGLPQYAIGLFVALAYGMMALSGATAAKAAARLGTGFAWLVPAAATGFTACALMMRVPALPLLCFWIYALNVFRQLQDNELQARASSDVRATVSSVTGLGSTALQVGLTFAVGAAADAWSYQAALIGFGFAAFACGLILVAIRPRA